MDRKILEERHRATGVKLFIAAWLVEILAAFVGLVIAGMTAYGIHAEILELEKEVKGAGYVNIILGALPFIMVAVVELTKIPLATAFYNSFKLRWRLVFGFSLLFLMFITFETALNGFERNFANLTQVIEVMRRDLVQTDEEIAEHEAEIDTLRTLDEQKIRELTSKRNDELQNARAIELSEIDRVIKDKVAISNTGLTASLKGSLNALEERIASLREDYQAAQARISKDYENNLKQVQGSSRSEQNTVEQQIANLDESLKELSREEAKAVDDALFFNVGSVRDNYNKRRADLVSQRTKLLDQLNNVSADPRMRRLAQDRDEALSKAKAAYDRNVGALDRERRKLNAQITDNAGSSQRTLNTEIKILNDQKKEIQTKYDGLKDKEEALLAEKLDDLANKYSKAEELENLKNDLSLKRLELRKTINEKVADNQVYRITQLWTGKDNAADVSKQEVRYTAIAWFGSLAAIVAATGTILAFAALVMMDPHQRNATPKKSVRNVLRRLFVDMRKYLRTPRIVTEYVEKEKVVELTKEVPVEKVVIQEVPREIVRKELVHVPLYTNDDSLLGNSHLKKGNIAEMNLAEARVEKGV